LPRHATQPKLGSQKALGPHAPPQSPLPPPVPVVVPPPAFVVPPPAFVVPPPAFVVPPPALPPPVLKASPVSALQPSTEAKSHVEANKPIKFLETIFLSPYSKLIRQPPLQWNPSQLCP
jgi:hypothetical protein